MCDLSGCEVEVPGEVIRSFLGTETAVLAVVRFQAGEVPFQPGGSHLDCYCGGSGSISRSAATWEARYGTAIAAVPFGYTLALRTAFLGALHPDL